MVKDTMHNMAWAAAIVSRPAESVEIDVLAQAEAIEEDVGLEQACHIINHYMHRNRAHLLQRHGQLAWLAAIIPVSSCAPSSYQTVWTDLKRKAPDAR